MATKKLTVAVLYGGRSGEHDISLQSAAWVMTQLNPLHYKIIPIAIDKKGRWLLQENPPLSISKPLSISALGNNVFLTPNSADNLPKMLFSLQNTSTSLSDKKNLSALPSIDIVIPILHGSFGEDGTIQGLLELADVPYVGCGVLASAVCMDKEVAKRLIAAAGLPVVPYLCLRKQSGQVIDSTMKQVDNRIGYPCFVKPAGLGSSLGVSKVNTKPNLSAAIQNAFQYDEKILIEQAIDAREIEVSVLENPQFGEPPLVSIPGEIVPQHEFYSYQAKYIDKDGAILQIPAQLTPEQIVNVQQMARQSFSVLDCQGMGRVDFFLSHKTGEIYFNEINTIPGFTSISMYPKLWEASGVAYDKLLDTLIELALARHRRKQSLLRE